MSDLEGILRHWLRDPAQAIVQRLDEAGSFSGTRLWRVAYAGRDFVLRRWPARVPVERLSGIHALQHYLAVARLPVPAPVPASATGQTAIAAPKGAWELAPWMPGTADYWTDPRPVKLQAACRALAEIHGRAATMPRPAVGWLPEIGVSPALRKREDRLHKLLVTEIKELVRTARRRPPSAERDQVLEALELIDRVAPREVERSLRWRDEKLPLQWALRDVWHDHVLFTDALVTGIIDFGAVRFDSPAGDVARLLGSLVGDDPVGWRIGLGAYESVRPLTEAERAAVDFFDTSGTVLSTGNWIVWLWPKPMAQVPPIRHRKAALARFTRLVERLRVLAARAH